MFLKNLKEDMVTKAIQDVLNDLKDVCKCSICVEDISSYVLNRVPPYYITSGRGILHLEKDIQSNFQSQADIYTLVLQAIRIIQNRRKQNIHNLPQNGIADLDKESIEVQKEYYLNFPYIVGRILSTISLNPKNGITIGLSIFKGSKYVLCEMKDNSWVNPYYIPNEFSGYFSFWPSPLLAQNQNEITKEAVSFKISVNDDEYTQEFLLDIFSDRIVRNQISTRHTFELSPILI